MSAPLVNLIGAVLAVVDPAARCNFAVGDVIPIPTDGEAPTTFTRIRSVPQVAIPNSFVVAQKTPVSESERNDNHGPAAVHCVARKCPPTVIAPQKEPALVDVIKI